MLLYRCDLCGALIEHRGQTYNLHLSYAGKSRVNLIRDGQYEICAPCTGKLEKILNDNKDSCTLGGEKDGDL